MASIIIDHRLAGTIPRYKDSIQKRSSVFSYSWDFSVPLNSNAALWPMCKRFKFNAPSASHSATNHPLERILHIYIMKRGFLKTQKAAKSTAKHVPNPKATRTPLIQSNLSSLNLPPSTSACRYRQNQTPIWKSRRYMYKSPLIDSKSLTNLFTNSPSQRL